MIANLTPPKNVKGIQSFLGHAGFYISFIKDFSQIAKPLTRLMNHDVKFVVYKAKVDVIAKLPPPENVKGIQSFLGHAGFYRRFIKKNLSDC